MTHRCNEDNCKLAYESLADAHLRIGALEDKVDKLTLSINNLLQQIDALRAKIYTTAN